MKLLITGLCLGGNKGGPAIALALMDQLRRQLGRVSFVLSVPGGPAWAHEARWAGVYGVEVVEDFGWSDLAGLSLRSLRRGTPAGAPGRLAAWTDAVRAADAVIEMSAISYFGPPVGTQEGYHRSARRRYYLTLRALGVPMIAWAQSYGPFSAPRLAAAARRDLRRQDVVRCRGAQTLEHVWGLMPGAAAESFPDVAVTLPYNRLTGSAPLSPAPGPEAAYVTVSPSAVMYARDPGHVDQMAAICRHLGTHRVEGGGQVVLVPHTLRPAGDGSGDPGRCDGAVCDLMLRRLKGLDGVQVVRADLTAGQLKSLIAAGDLHVGARYHSVVAALSSGVPTLSLGWHHKYADVMAQFDCARWVCDAGDDDAAIGARLDALWAERSALCLTLDQAQGRLARQVELNAQQVADQLRAVVERRRKMKRACA